MSIIGLVVLIALLGLIAGLVYKAPVIPETFKWIIYVVLVICALFIVAYAFGFIGALNTPVPKIGGH